ncbi:MAG TPA: zinc dependent phospholipase C family protein [Modicisalibacter sp.]|nr:zinc dependent phospholipase C family protein [Modicisalibacter sp.]
MPGAYAHITAVNIASEISRLEGANVSKQLVLAAAKYLKLVELGAVSPDYPYLDISIGSSAKAWADKMHYTDTGEMIRAGLELLPEAPAEDREKALAWLMGYAAHVVTDLTIHPVVESRVGPYAQNAKEHRICEMHQDAHVFQRLGLGPVGIAEHLDSGIGRCSEPESDDLDSVVALLWRQMLERVYPHEYASNPPNPCDWHSGFKTIVDAAEEGYKLFPFARHVAAGQGLTYPAQEKIDSSYIESLATPGNIPMHYDDIFDHAVENILVMWRDMGEALERADAPLFAKLGAWNLDTGRDADGQYVYWRVA